MPSCPTQPRLVSISVSSVTPFIGDGPARLESLLAASPRPPLRDVASINVNIVQTPLVIDLNSASSWAVSMSASSLLVLLAPLGASLPVGFFVLTLKRFASDGAAVVVETPVLLAVEPIIFTAAASELATARFTIPMNATLPRGKYVLQGSFELTSAPESYDLNGNISLYASATVSYMV